MSTPPEILVVEDDPVTARLLSRQLQRAGHPVILAGSCSAAISAEGPFEIAILDIDLGDGDGIELGAQLLVQQRVRRVIFHSAVQDPVRRAAAERLGPIIAKSGSPHELLSMLEAVLAAEKLGP